MATTAASKTLSDFTPPIVEYALLLLVPPSTELSVHFGVSVLVLGSPENFSLNNICNVHINKHS